MSTWGFTSDHGDTWREKAACVGIDPELFFSPGIGAEDVETVEAKAFCKAFCTVRAECLKWALEHGEDFGVWGGTTPAERRGTQRARQNLANGMCANGHPWTSENVRYDRRGGEYCVVCRRECAAKSHATVVRRKQQRVLAEQFPPVHELVQELPGVRDRERHTGRPREAVTVR